MANFGASVTSTSPNKTDSYNAGEAVAIGDSVYLDATTNTWKLADSTALSTLGSTGISNDMGVALNTAISGGDLTVLLSGLLENCSSLSAGGIYCVSDSAAGEVILSASLTEDTDYACVMGVAKSTTEAYIRPVNSGAVVNLV